MFAPEGHAACIFKVFGAPNAILGIATEAAEHFMRIVTTDATDAAVDSGTDDDGAENAANEPPSTITNNTSS